MTLIDLIILIILSIYHVSFVIHYLIFVMYDLIELKLIYDESPRSKWEIFNKTITDYERT